MSTFGKIVVATDFSSTALEALRMAHAMGREGHSEIHLLYVIPDVLQVPWMSGNAGIGYYSEMENGWKAQARQRLDALIAQEGLDPEHTVTAVLLGHPARMIVGYSEAEEADLIVMGAHGNAGLGPFMLGSVADRVVRQSRIPVLTVPGERKVAARIVPRHEAKESLKHVS